jgi:hypothetical protein
MDFVVLPIMGCALGAYAGLLRKTKAPVLAIACLLPLLIFEIVGDPVGTWSNLKDIQFFGMRALELFLAGIVALGIRRALDARISLVRTSK